MNNEAKEVTKLVENSELRRRDIEHAWHELEQARSTYRDEQRLDHACEAAARNAEQFLRELNGIQEELHYGRRIEEVSKRLETLKRDRRSKAENDLAEIRHICQTLMKMYQINLDTVRQVQNDMEKSLNGVSEDVRK